LTEAKVEANEAKIIRELERVEALEITIEALQRGLEI
jgi:hypothetical protein